MFVSSLGLFFFEYLMSGDCEVIHLKIWRRAFIYIMYIHVNRTVGARHIYLSIYGCEVTKLECDKKQVNIVLLFHRHLINMVCLFTTRPQLVLSVDCVPSQIKMVLFSVQR